MKGPGHQFLAAFWVRMFCRHPAEEEEAGSGGSAQADALSGPGTNTERTPTGELSSSSGGGEQQERAGGAPEQRRKPGTADWRQSRRSKMHPCWQLEGGCAC